MLHITKPLLQSHTLCVPLSVPFAHTSLGPHSWQCLAPAPQFKPAWFWYLQSEHTPLWYHSLHTLLSPESQFVSHWEPNLVNYNANSHLRTPTSFVSKVLPGFFIISVDFSFPAFHLSKESSFPKYQACGCVPTKQLRTLLSSRASGAPETQDMLPRSQEHLIPESGT